MSNIEFKLMSPDRSNKACQTDCTLCFTCLIAKKSCTIDLLKKVNLLIAFFYNIT